MKTTTILEAWDRAAQEAEIYADDMRKLQRAGRIYAGLVRRIELGERAREILRIFADDQNWDFDSCGLVNWDFGEVIDGQWQSFNPAQIAREALGR